MKVCARTDPNWPSLLILDCEANWRLCPHGSVTTSDGRIQQHFAGHDSCKKFNVIQWETGIPWLILESHASQVHVFRVRLEQGICRKFWLNPVMEVDMSWSCHFFKLHYMTTCWQFIILASCPWGPVTVNGVDLLTEMYVIFPHGASRSNGLYATDVHQRTNGKLGNIYRWLGNGYFTII